MIIKDERRLELSELNARAWNGEEVFPLKRIKLDSSIKRNTGFIKKLKLGITKDSKTSLLKDLSEVSLEKYLSEIISTADEGLQNVGNRNEDVAAVVEVISGLHQRFSTRFTGELMALFLNHFSCPQDDSVLTEKETSTRVNKLRTNLRIFGELYLVGIFSSVDNVASKDTLPAFLKRRLGKKEPILLSILKEVLSFRFSSGFSSSIATLFVKKFPQLFEKDNLADKYLYDKDLKYLLQHMFKKFTEVVSTRAVQLNKRTRKLLKEHRKSQIRTGKETDDFLEEYNVILPQYEKFRNAALTLSEFFNLNAPELNDETELRDDEIARPSVVTSVASVPAGQKVWENDEVRKFYEVLPNIGEYHDQSLKNTSDPGDKVNDFFRELEEAETKEDIDHLSILYWSQNLDNKASRKRLMKFLIENKDWSKLKLYCRFFATNSKYFDDLTGEVVNYVDNGFRVQLHSGKINVKNIIFFSEMVKFMMLPVYMIFHKIRTLIINLHAPNNIEILAVVFEHVGIFLVNKPEYKAHMEKMMELFKEKKKDRQLSINLKGAMDNLITLVYPPSIKSLNASRKDLSPEQRFYHILIRRELQSFGTRRVVKLLRRAHWKDKIVTDSLFALFVEPEKLSYQNISILARVLGELYKYQRNFTMDCIDELLEKIERGLEIKDFSHSMHRIAEVKYLTEIYNFELIKPNVFLDTMYLILRYGHDGKGLYLFVPNEIDEADNYFKIQLLSTMLLSLREDISSLSDRLSLFLRFFEYYTFTKEQPLPQDIQFRLQSIFRRYGEQGIFEKSSNIKESITRLTLMVKSLSGQNDTKENSNNNLAHINAEFSDDESDHDQEEEDDDDDDDEFSVIEDTLRDAEREIDDEDDETDEGEDESEDDDEGDEDDDDEGDDDDDDEGDEDDDDDDDGDDDDDDDYRDVIADRDIERKRMFDEYQARLKDDNERKMEEELEKQLQQITQDSMDARKNEKVVTAKIPLLTSKKSNPSIIVEPSETDVNQQQPSVKKGQPQKIPFTFLNKSGKRTQTRMLRLPTNVEFVSGVLEEEERLKNEREKIKNIVLQRAFD